MRKEVEARRSKIYGPASAETAPRRRSRDADGFLELELLPLEQLDRVPSTRHRRKG